MTAKRKNVAKHKKRLPGYRNVPDFAHSKDNLDAETELTCNAHRQPLTTTHSRTSTSHYTIYGHTAHDTHINESTVTLAGSLQLHLTSGAARDPATGVKFAT